MYATNVKNKPHFLVPNGMLVVSAIFLIGEELGLFKLIFVKNSKNIFLVLKSIFQNKIIIWQRDAKLEKV